MAKQKHAYHDHLKVVPLFAGLDEDELDEAVRIGIMPSQRAAKFRNEGERAISRLTTRTAPFDRMWEEWRPDPRWDFPALSSGWDDLAQHPSPYGHA